MGALEIVADKKTKAPFDLAAVGAGNRVYNHAVERGLFIRNMLATMVAAQKARLT